MECLVCKAKLKRKGQEFCGQPHWKLFMQTYPGETFEQTRLRLKLRNKIKGSIMK